MNHALGTGKYHTNPILQELENSRERKALEESKMQRKLSEALRKINEEVKYYKDMYVRQRAEMENFVKSKEREMKAMMQNANRELIKSLLPTIDSMEAAILSDKNAGDIAPLREQMLRILSDFGLKAIDAKGKKFDPFLHEVIAVTPDGEDGLVVEEIQKGYMLNNQVVRTSKVIVVKR